MLKHVHHRELIGFLVDTDSRAPARPRGADAHLHCSHHTLALAPPPPSPTSMQPVGAPQDENARAMAGKPAVAAPVAPAMAAARRPLGDLNAGQGAMMARPAMRPVSIQTLVE